MDIDVFAADLVKCEALGKCFEMEANAVSNEPKWACVKGDMEEGLKAPGQRATLAADHALEEQEGGFHTIDDYTYQDGEGGAKIAARRA